jgi:hypothetical protein
MALNTQCTVAWLTVISLLVEMVLEAVVGITTVALKAQVVPLFEQSKAVNVVAIAAAHVVLVHFALNERPVYIHLLEDLTIRVVKPFAEHCRELAVHQMPASMVVIA